MERLKDSEYQELYDFSRHEGTEWGEGARGLCSIYHTAHHLSDEFFEAYNKEMKRLYDQMIEETEVVIEKERIYYKETSRREWVDF